MLKLSSLRFLSSNILHQKNIIKKSISLVDIDKISRNIYYYESSSSPSSPSPSPSSSSSSSSSSMTSNIPLILLLGTAQTITTWLPHIRGLSINRNLIIIEMRSQGNTELLSSSSNLEQLSNDLYEFLKIKNINKINLVGFSLGGRISIAFASKYPKFINKLSITGVPLIRPGLGQLILQSWKEGLEHNDIKSTAWSCILNGFSNQFLYKNHKTIPQLVDSLIEQNDFNKLKDLLQNSNDSLLPYIKKENFNFPVQIICSNEDRLAGNGSEKELIDYLTNDNNKLLNEYVMIENSGHLIPFEKPTLWRTSLISFLDK